MLPGLLTSSRRFFHINRPLYEDRPLYEVLLKPLFGFLKGWFNLLKDDRVFIFLGSAGN